MYDCLAIVRRGMYAGQRKICADNGSKGGRQETGLPASVPGAHHNRNGKDNEPAFDDDIRKQKSGNQRQNKVDTQNSDGITENRGLIGRDETPARKGGLHSHDNFEFSSEMGSDRVTVVA